MNINNKDEVRRRVRTLEIATEDAQKRIMSSPTDYGYVQEQKAKINGWESERQFLLTELNKEDDND